MTLDKLITQLEELRVLLNTSPVEAYCGLKRHSPLGDACKFVRAAGLKLLDEGTLPIILEKCQVLSKELDSLYDIEQEFRNPIG